MYAQQLLLPTVAWTWPPRSATRPPSLQPALALPCSLACIVWLVLSAAQEVLMEQQFASVLYVILLAFGQHCFYLVLNFAVVV